jgi:hypothetical protein
MKNLEYWKTSLENVLEKEDVTYKLVEKIIGISEMEYEYTEFESHKPNRIEINPLNNKIKELENKIRVYENALCKIHKADFVRVVGERVEWERRM